MMISKVQQALVEEQAEKISRAIKMAQGIIPVEADCSYDVAAGSWDLDIKFGMPSENSPVDLNGDLEENLQRLLDSMSKHLGIEPLSGGLKAVEVNVYTMELRFTGLQVESASRRELTSLIFDDGRTLRHQTERIFRKLGLKPDEVDFESHEVGVDQYSRGKYIFNEGIVEQHPVLIPAWVPRFGGRTIYIRDVNFSALHEIEKAFREDPVFPREPAKKLEAEGARAIAYARPINPFLVDIPLERRADERYVHEERIAFSEPGCLPTR